MLRKAKYLPVKIQDDKLFTNLRITPFCSLSGWNQNKCLTNNEDRERRVMLAIQHGKCKKETPAEIIPIIKTLHFIHIKILKGNPQNYSKYLKDPAQISCLAQAGRGKIYFALSDFDTPVPQTALKWWLSEPSSLVLAGWSERLHLSRTKLFIFQKLSNTHDFSWLSVIWFFFKVSAAIMLGWRTILMRSNRKIKLAHFKAFERQSQRKTKNAKWVKSLILT